MNRKVGLLLAGCGAYDGSDPQETVLTMLAFNRAGFQVLPMSPEGPLFHRVNHLSGEEMESLSKRASTVAEESARLVRGKIYTLGEVAPGLLDAVVVPGGQGAVKNLLSGFGSSDGQEPAPAVGEFLRAAHEKGVVIGALSLGEFVLVHVFGPWPGGAGCLELTPTETLCDPERRMVLAPGNLSARDLPELFASIQSFCEKVVSLVEGKEPKS